MLSVIGLALDGAGAVGLALALLARARFKVGYGGPAWPDEETEATAHGFASIGVTFLPAGFILQAIPYLGWAPECSRGVTLLVGVATLALGTLELCETRWWVESSTAKTRTAKRL